MSDCVTELEPGSTTPVVIWDDSATAAAELALGVEAGELRDRIGERVDLCPSCTSAFVAWLRAEPEPEPEAERPTRPAKTITR